MNSTDDNIKTTLAEIRTHLDVIRDYLGWMILADQRFGVGQWVEWSRKGQKAGFPSRKKAKRGTIKAINGFSIVVKLHGQKKPRSYHHSFFNPVDGPKLF